MAFHHLDTDPEPRHIKNHMLTSSQPGRQWVGRRESALKPQAWRNRMAIQLHGCNNWGQCVLLDSLYRSWLIRAVFSLNAPEKRQCSEPDEFLRQRKAIPHNAKNGLGSQPPPPPTPGPAPPNSSVALGRSVTPFVPQSQSAEWESNSSYLIGLLLIYIKCTETIPDRVSICDHHHYGYYYYFLCFV